MSRLRSITAQSPAIAISIIALVFALGSGAGYAASRHVAASKDLTMHGLTLRNGWASSESAYGTGNPSYTVANGIVYLSGSAHQTISGGSDEVTVLPRSARPKHFIYLSIYTLDGTAGSMEITPGGIVYGYNETNEADAEGYISFAGISFPAGS
jgi:hypothetical protein